MTFALTLAFFAIQTAPPPAPALIAAPPVSPVVVEAPPPAPDPEKIATDLAVIYDQSCGGRLYGTYAQACNGLSEQLAKAQADARRAAKLKARKAATAGR